MDNGYLEIRMSGKSKLYCTTEIGKIHISHKLNDYKLVFQHVLCGGIEPAGDSNDKK
jgi:hypothetical protein